MKNQMEKPKEIITEEIPKQTEKEKLEIIEKKVEIQKKRMELRKEKLSMDKMIQENENDYLEFANKKLSIRNKHLENKRAKLDMEDLIKSRIVESEKLLNDKIFSLLYTLTVTVVDDERTILGSEPFYKPIINGKRRDIAIEKLMELIKKI